MGRCASPPCGGWATAWKRLRLVLFGLRRLKSGSAPAPVAGQPGFPREQRSLFAESIDWMIAPLLLLWPMSVVLTSLVAQGIANKPFDRELGDKARLLS